MSEFLDQIKSFSPKRLALLAAELKESLDRVQAVAREPIAVIGIGCRFPGSDSPDAYWAFLREGRDGIREVPADRWPIDQYFDPDPDAPGKIATRYGGFLDQISEFDANFFGIAPREALVMDPQQRLLLEASWEALEHAGLAPAELVAKRVGVFVGICNTDYLQLLLMRGEKAIDAYLASGSAFSVAAGRLSYVLGFQGPSMSIDTSCSASLVAIHAACQSLRAGESTLALAGGVNVICAPETYIALSRAHMLAPDGRCKTFDAAADGFGRAEGCGMVVLKRLSDAQRDGDRIIALVRGTAINQDGRSGGLTVPNGPAQESVIRDALAMAEVSGADIDYVEAHGTGTSLGDPIEVRALGRVLGENREANDPLLIGSVKSNFGHLESAAGVAGFIKVALSLQHQEIPRSLHFKNPSQNIDWNSLPVQVVAENRAWPRGARPRRAGVSSFGFSGTNAHAILEEAPVVNDPVTILDRPLHCLTLSAVSEAALSELANRYAESMASNAKGRLADVAYTAATGRTHLKHRVVAVVGDEAEARTALATIAAGGADPKIRRGLVAPDSETDVVFLYTGAGAQYPGMGQALYDTSPVFRDAIDRCDALLGADPQGLTLKSVLRATEHAEPAIHNIEWTQPALFAVEYALTELWRSWGVKPAAVIGHSVGEYAAACAAGVFSLEDGLKLIAQRGRLLQSVSRGGMMAAVFAPFDEVAKAVAGAADQVAIAAINAPENVVVSGEAAAVEALLASFQRKNINAQQLYVSLAAHSPMVDPALDDMETLARTVSMSAPRIPVAWNLVGGSLPGGAAPDALYWRRHMREPVRFADGIKALHNDGYRIFLEVGPHPTLLALAQQSLPTHGVRFLTSLRRGKDDWRELLTSLADFHVGGVEVDWAGVDRPYSRRRITLPTYPFQRERYWAAPRPSVHRGDAAVSVEAAGPLPSPSNADLFYTAGWEKLHGGYSRFPSSLQLNENAGERFDALATENGFSIYDRLMPELDCLSLAYIKNAFVQLGFDDTLGRRFSATTESARLGIAKQHVRLFARLLTLLAEHKFLKADGDGYIVAQALAEEDAVSLGAELLVKFGNVSGELELVQRCGGKLAQVLRGEQDPLPLLFPEGSFAAVRKIYAESPYARTYNGMLAELIRRAVVQHDGAPVRVLEIGAGTGSTTSFVLPVLGRQAQYTFTDVSPVFLSQASEQFSDYPNLRTAVLDIERDPKEQGFEAGKYDVVIAANVLHATADLRKTMANVSTLLAPGGMLFIAEAVKPAPWIDLTFGLTEGWWRFGDLTRRKDGPLIEVDGWRRLLVETHFEDVSAFSGGAKARDRAASQALITAKWPDKNRRRRWVILGDASGTADHFKMVLSSSHDRVLVVPSADWRRAAVSIEELRKQKWWPSDEEAEVVYLGALDDRESINSGSDHISQVALTVLQAVADARGLRIWLVTCGAQDVQGVKDVVAPEQAAIWGLGRTFALEHPEEWGGLIDLDPSGDPADAAMLIADTVLANDGEDQLAWRNGVRHVARILAMPTPDGGGPISLGPEVSYLITGGLGGVGVEVAKWLVSRGARHLVLANRTAMPPRSEWAVHKGDRRVQAITELEEAGATVDAVAVDVGDSAAMAEFMAHFGEEWPPLGGIVHAAVAPTAAALVDMRPDLLAAMFRTKVQSALLLDSLSASQPVEFFVNFSTTTAILGSAQLAHYAASNAVLDALACRRSAEGKPALSINWGSWDKLLSVSEEEREHIARGGLRPMATEKGLAALELLIKARATRAIVAEVDWPVLRAVYESRRAQPMLSRVATTSLALEKADGLGVEAIERRQINFTSLDPVERRDAIEIAVRREVAQVIGLPTPDKVDPGLDLFKLGMDSLMAIELRSRLERVVATTLPSSVAFSYPTVVALSAFLDETVAARTHTSDGLEDVSALLDRVDQMSDDEINSLLKKMLPEGSVA